MKINNNNNEKYKDDVDEFIDENDQNMESINILESIKKFFHITSFIIIYLFSLIYPKKNDVEIHGYVKPGFEKVYDAFKKNFEEKWEPDGASLSIYHKNELIVNIYGGYSDKESLRKWKEDTLSIIFSTTKSISAICIAILVDRELLNYNDKIIDFWPEFGKNDKEDITVQWILSHMSGLAYFDEKITIDDAKDWKKMSNIIENEYPKWKPGTAVGYHAITYGWLVDQIIRRIDPQKRSLGQFYHDELQKPLGLDLYIGLPESEVHRVSRIRLPSLKQRISEYIHNPSAVNYYKVIYDLSTDGLLSKVERNPEWLRFVKEMTLNNPEYYELEQGALLGIGTTKSLAKLFSYVFIEKKLFKNSKTLEKLLTPYTKIQDIITGAVVARGQGLMFNDFITNKNKKICIIGHSGYGGQNTRVDVTNEISFSYLSNGLKGGFGDTARTFIRLRDSIYDCLF